MISTKYQRAGGTCYRLHLKDLDGGLKVFGYYMFERKMVDQNCLEDVFK